MKTYDTRPVDVYGLLTYAHDRSEVVLGGGGDLQAGRPDVLDGGVKVTQLCGDGPLVHWTHQMHK